MALAEVCGLNLQDFKQSNKKAEIDDEIQSYTGNFNNNMMLATPMFANVSFLLQTIFFINILPFIKQIYVCF